MSGLEFLRSALRPRTVLSLSALMLAACGGGDGDDSDISGNLSSTTVQYPAGVWSGSSGDGQTMFGIVDPGTVGVRGTSGFFYFARGGDDNTGYDGLFGNLTMNGSRLTANNASYYIRPADILTGTGQFRSVSVSAILAGRDTATWSSPNGTMDGRFSSPYVGQTQTFITFGMQYDSNLSDRDSSLFIDNGIQGAYRGDTADRSGWSLYIDWAGRLSGRNGNCRFYGQVTPRSDAANSGATSPLYGVSMTLYQDFGSDTCGQVGMSMSGTAIVLYDEFGKRGIWMATRSVSQSANTYVLQGSYLAPSQLNEVPRTFDVTSGSAGTSAQNPVGVWSGNDPFLTTTKIDMIVLPNGEYLMYRNGGNGDVLYSYRNLAIGMESNTGRFYNNRGIFWYRDGNQTFSGIHFAGALRTGSGGRVLRALFDDPANNFTSGVTSGLPSAMDLEYVDPPSRDGATLFRQLVKDRPYGSDGNALSFGSRPSITRLSIETQFQRLDGELVLDGNGQPIISGYLLKGEATASCLIEATLDPTPNTNVPNMFAVNGLNYLNAGTGVCALSGEPSQNGVLVLDSLVFSSLENSLIVSNLRLLTAANPTSESSGGFTIFKGYLAQ